MTYTTFYFDNPQWYHNTSSSTAIQYIYGMSNSPCRIETKHKPKFEVGDTIVYLSYLKWSNKLAIHKIKEITDTHYIVFSALYLDEVHEMEIDKTDEHFCLLEDCMEDYPDLYLKAERNGPKDDYIKGPLVK